MGTMLCGLTRYAASAAATRPPRAAPHPQTTQQNQAFSQCRRDPTPMCQPSCAGGTTAASCNRLQAEGRICTGIQQAARAASTRYSTWLRPCAPSHRRSCRPRSDRGERKAPGCDKQHQQRPLPERQGDALDQHRDDEGEDDRGKAQRHRRHPARREDASGGERVRRNWRSQPSWRSMARRGPDA